MSKDSKTLLTVVGVQAEVIDNLKEELEIVKNHRDEEYGSNVGLESQVEDLTEKLSDVHEDLRKSVIEKRSLKQKVKELESELKAIGFIMLASDSLIDYQHDEIKSLEGKISSLEGSDYNSEVNVLKRENYALRERVQELEEENKGSLPDFREFFNL